MIEPGAGVVVRYFMIATAVISYAMILARNRRFLI